MTGAATVAVTGYGLHLPDADLTADFPFLAGRIPPGRACPPDQAHVILGRKGLLGKDAATRLALCAVHGALRLAPGAARPAGPPDPGTAVVVSSNLGNVASVVDTARSAREGGRRAISPLAVPNASSNVVASTVAIWFRLGGPNVMVCSGATSGLDAVALGTLMLRAGRARRVVVVGTEPADDDALALYRERTVPASPLRAGAACVVLEPDGPPGTPRLGLVRTERWPANAPSRSRLVSWLDGAAGSELDLAGMCGDLYGAAGVALVALAAGLSGHPGADGVVEVECGDGADGGRAAAVRAAGEDGPGG